MFPQLLPRIGKHAATGIQKQITLHVPNCYKPIMRMVSSLFNACVEQKFESMPDQLAILQTLVKQDDLKLLKFYNEQMYWDISMGQLLELSFECNASLETIVYLFQFRCAGSDTTIVDDLVIEHDRKDVFDYLTSNTSYKPSLVGFVYEAVEQHSFWPLEWIIKNNIKPTTNNGFEDVFDCLQNSNFDVDRFLDMRLRVLDQKAMFWLRQLLRLMIEHTFDFIKFSPAVSSFYLICFLVLVDTKRASDFALFYEFHHKFYVWTRHKYNILTDAGCTRMSNGGGLAPNFLRLIKAENCGCNNKEIHKG